MIDPSTSATIFYNELIKVHRLEIPIRKRARLLLELLNNISTLAVEQTDITFHTIFSMLSYIGHKYNLPSSLLYRLNRFRLWAKANGSSETTTLEKDYQLGIYSISHLIRGITGVPLPPGITEILPADPQWVFDKQEKKRFIKSVRITALEKDSQKKIVFGYDANEPAGKIRVKYHLKDRNDVFLPGMELIGNQIPLPVEINLLDVEIDDQGCYLPQALIIQPDYLIDITAVSECFKDSGVFPVAYLLKKLIPLEPNKHLMLGNIANFFLDELVSNPEMPFKTLIQQSFGINPLAFCMFPDVIVYEIVQKAKRHYESLKQMVAVDFARHGIDIKEVLLEPTFYSERYGLQGRLDLFHMNARRNGEAAIVELKSSKPFRPNVYGLNQPHYIQTLLYDLLIKSMSDDKLRPTNYILYSVKEQDHLRFAPAVKSQQYEALAIRNELIAMEYKIASLGANGSGTLFLEWIKNEGADSSGFIKRDIDQITSRLSGLNHLEQRYFFLFLGFIAREQFLAKIGTQKRQDNGQASLWLKTIEEKEDQYTIISHLELEESNIDQPDPMLVFRRTPRTNPLANFRKGDLAILYPYQPDKPALGHQLFKGTISELDQDFVHIRLRAKQMNKEAFSHFQYWNVEHDLLDSSFNIYFQSLFTFSGFSLEQRQLFLGMQPPGRSIGLKNYKCDGLTEEQDHIFQKIIAAPDYFLLWGPPGTGKTSVMLKQIVKFLFETTDEEILLLAYTNRAVDEICRALEHLGPQWKENYLRIGSRYSTHSDFRSQLLVEKMAKVKSRRTLRKILSSYRIVVSTVTSLAGSKELFRIKKFKRLIVDEATQILEPLMAGILPRIPWVLLIGDHQQLAAVVSQSKKHRTVSDPALIALGLSDAGNSYFERLYKRCIEEGWDWAYDRLTYQGRMHKEIMAFPSELFYQNSLKILPGNERQEAEISLRVASKDPLDQLLVSKRVLFFSVKSKEVMTSKTNYDEAVLVAEIVLAFTRLYRENGRTFQEKTLGIMTPYRAQIAQITGLLRQRNFDPGMITIDTVERYQGGSRDIVIISLCTNAPGQLATLVSEGEEGVDRKLNVALTRAREHLVVIGDPAILSENRVYAKFIERYTARYDNGNSTE